ncbi:hypothetical protein NDU88_002808 [Pleurodeles waltl]|uniref:Uncharacterized protein n=1 Tax=Pleurodeles waltl TaxID=8319 RepID=A0AAV7QAF0_PLEWA|nr:hypothetical protein NDU88_002808 [Pleurodeles waltl]
MTLSLCLPNHVGDPKLEEVALPWRSCDCGGLDSEVPLRRPGSGLSCLERTRTGARTLRAHRPGCLAVCGLMRPDGNAH